MISGLRQLLADPSISVQVPAAVSLYCFGRETGEVSGWFEFISAEHYSMFGLLMFARHRVCSCRQCVVGVVSLRSGRGYSAWRWLVCVRGVWWRGCRGTF